MAGVYARRCETQGVDRSASSPLGASATLAELAGPDPHALLDRLREREPVSWLPALDGWLVTRRDVALAVMRDADAFTVDDPRFSTAQVVGPSMLSLDGLEHERHRAPFARAFRLGPITETLTELVEAECDRLLAGVVRHGHADLRTALSGPLSVAVMAAVLGLDDLPPAVPLDWYRAIVEAVTDLTAGSEASPDGTAAFAALGEALAPVLEREPAATLLGSAARGAGALGRDEVVSNAAVLLFGGIETTDGMIANAFWHVLANDVELDGLVAQPALAANAVEESLRLEPAAAVVDRYATRDVALGGVAIGKRDLVRVSLAAANRDPSVFPDPHRFAPGRENAKLHAAFAHGPHVCLGMHLARLETRVALARAAARLPGLRLDTEADGRPTGLVFRKPPALRVRWETGAGGTVTP
jgi:cytochrome P450